MASNNLMFKKIYQRFIHQLLEEDDLGRNAFYFSSLPNDEVNCVLKIKSDVSLSGLPFFISVFEEISGSNLGIDHILEDEGKKFLISNKKEFSFKMPFNVAITGERLALNLLTRSSAISTQVDKIKNKLRNKKIKILDTRKTTPGLRWLEKYAVVMGGGCNHRFGQNDVWMIKDNHKKFFGGMSGACAFFRSLNDFYRPLVVEVHSLKELEEAISLEITHVMLDNFKPTDVKCAVGLKKPGMTFEISGGINEHNIHEYSIEGVDAISIGGLTHGVSAVDMSLKFE